MDLERWIGSVMTVIAFSAFVGIVIWAYGRGRKRAFDEAANAPFALPDDERAPRARPNAGEGR